MSPVDLEVVADALRTAGARFAYLHGSQVAGTALNGEQGDTVTLTRPYDVTVRL